MSYLAAFLMAFVTLTGVASGQGFGYPGERPATNPALYELRDMAIRFWADRDVIGCPDGVAVDTATDLSDDDQGPETRGRGGNCRIVLLDQGWRHWWKRDLFFQAGIRESRCSVVLHEVGHALGLPHLPPGVPGVMAGAGAEPTTPYMCFKWAGLPSRRRAVLRLVDRQVARRHP